MAIWIHNSDESILVEADVLEGHLTNGWSLEAPGSEVVEDEMTEEELEVLIEEESQDDNES